MIVNGSPTLRYDHLASQLLFPLTVAQFAKEANESWLPTYCFGYPFTQFSLDIFSKVNTQLLLQYILRSPFSTVNICLPTVTTGRQQQWWDRQMVILPAPLTASSLDVKISSNLGEKFQLALTFLQI